MKTYFQEWIFSFGMNALHFAFYCWGQLSAVSPMVCWVFIVLFLMESSLFLWCFCNYELCRRADGLTAAMCLFVLYVLKTWISKLFCTYHVISVHLWWHVFVLLVMFFSAWDTPILFFFLLTSVREPKMYFLNTPPSPPLLSDLEHEFYSLPVCWPLYRGHWNPFWF